MKRDSVRSSFYLLLLAAALAVVTECLNTKSFIDGILFPAAHPYAYVMNVLLLWSVYSVCLLFRRRVFVLGCALVLTMGLAVANCVVQMFRSTPLAAIDFSILRSMFKVLPKYMKLWQIIAIAAALAGCVIALAVLFRKCKRHPRRVLPALVCMLVPPVCFGVLYSIGEKTGCLPERISALTEDYRAYGFPYAFTRSVFDRGIDRPDTYTQEEMDEITEKLESVETEPETEPTAGAVADKKPNVIVLQLESFIDVNRMEGYTFSEDPVTCFAELKRTCPSGYLTVPSLGGGTANTEFEVLTGMCLSYFGAGEYPYKTCLQETTCESMAYLLRNAGYTTHAIHDNTATFYDRNTVYPKLGFDTFTPLEYMENVTYNELGWAEDKVLLDVITDTLDSTVGADFVFAVSVQPHGKYPTDYVSAADDITFTSPEPLTAEETSALTYYIREIHAVDTFLSALLDTLSAREEETLLVVYGDHLPSLSAVETVLQEASLFQTEYAIWYSGERKSTVEDEDLAAYQLSAKVLPLCGVDDGIIPRLHRGYKGTEQYASMLEMVEYDMLYGERILYNGVEVYPEVQMRYGTRTNAYTAKRMADGSLEITAVGESLINTWTHVSCNGWQCDGTWDGARTITVPREEVPAILDTVTIAQIADDGTVLGETMAILS